MNLLSYRWSFVYGLYFYVVFQIVYWKRFGSLNWSIEWTDLGLLIVGIVSFFMFQYYALKLASKWWLMIAPFLLALPLAVIAALGGGLLGMAGVIFFGLVPFVIFLPLGYWLVKKFIMPPLTNDTGGVL